MTVSGLVSSNCRPGQKPASTRSVASRRRTCVSAIARPMHAPTATNPVALGDQGRGGDGDHRLGHQPRDLEARITARAVADGDIDLTTHEPEFSAFRWVDLKTLPSLIVPFKRDTYKAVIAALGKYA